MIVANVAAPACPDPVGDLRGHSSCAAAASAPVLGEGICVEIGSDGRKSLCGNRQGTASAVP
jgi:hypothetical protein